MHMLSRWSWTEFDHLVSVVRLFADRVFPGMLAKSRLAGAIFAQELRRLSLTFAHEFQGPRLSAAQEVDTHLLHHLDEIHLHTQ